jgi:uncharacterized protein YjbI with pentapeptide repeats
MGDQHDHLVVIELVGADLQGANLMRAYLRGADFGAANLRFAKLDNSDLSYAHFSLPEAFSALEEDAGTAADLTGATLTRANLEMASLSGADLSGATDFTNEELEQQAKSLESATMPNGQKYEDWLKDKKAHEEGG